MEMLEAKPGGFVLQFDGRVLEFFGGVQATSAWRRHIALINGVVVTGPDKRGDWSIALQPPPKLITAFTLSQAEFEAVQPILDALRGAGVNVSVNA
ncbi:MAG TPA: hypothetical protein VIX84_19975 [Acidimicrobiales bacterium]